MKLRNFLPFLFILLFSVASWAQIPANSKQAILCLSEDWKSSQGYLYCYERNRIGNWHFTGVKVPVRLGEKGLGWGLGFHPLNQTKPSQPYKQEGDKKAPAGIFPILSIFGQEATLPQELQNDDPLPYQSTFELTCVDDSDSFFYNMIVPSEQEEKDWKSGEDMDAIDLYQRGIVIGHNLQQKAKAGSCIFMHLWKDSETTTSGCTAMEKKDIETLIRWLKAEDNPILIQLPRDEFNAKRRRWKLP